MFTPPCGKALICKPWLAAIVVAWPVWFGLYQLSPGHFDPGWAVESPMPFFMLVLLYPLLEEIVFRGFLQESLLKLTPLARSILGITLANVVTSIMFAAAHLISHTPLMAALVILPSLLFGYFRDRFDGWLIPSILLHIYYNLGYFLIIKPAF